MARTYTRLEILNRVRQRADVENSTHVTDSEINVLIDVNYPKYYDILVASAPPDYFTTTQTITVVAGTAAYSLPATYYKTRRVYFTTSSGYSRPIVAMAESDIELFTAPVSGGSVYHEYIPSPTKLTSDADTIDGINGWEELLVIDCAIDIKTKREQSIQQLQGRRNELMSRITSMAPRDMGTPQHVQRRWNRRVIDPFYDLTNLVDRYRIVGSNIELYRHGGYYV